jgi:ABC-type transport system involved in multi-copper enzyme maturation permease subunit
MLMGPIFRSELLRTARRKRYYMLRVLYGLLLLLLIWARYERKIPLDGVMTIADVAAFAGETFIMFAVVQMVTVLLLIPPLFGGVIADEKQRKTLHYLMASQLSSGEIILDKVLGRAPHLGIFVAMGLPVLCIMSLFGGVALDMVFIAYVGTFSTAMFAVALTVLVSTLARRVRQAILCAYVLLSLWFFLPSLLQLFGTIFFPGPYQWIRPVNDWLNESSPLGIYVMSRFPGGLGRRLGTVLARVETMVQLQLGGAVVLLLLSAWRLRPVFRRQEATPARRTWFRTGRRGRRWFARPDCGDDAVVWKERYFAPADIFTKLVLLPAIVVATIPLAMLTELEGNFSQVFFTFWYAGFNSHLYLANDFLWAVRLDLAWYTAFWLLAVAGASASSVTTEREEDTWVSLTSTPLTGWQIVRGKVFGVIWNQRGFGAVLLFLWFAGLVTGAAHPLGILASMALVAVLTWFVAALGIHASLRARSTSRALVSTIVALWVLNGYPFIILAWFMDKLEWESSFSLLGVMPRLVAAPLVTYREFSQAWLISNASDPRHIAATPAIIVGLLLLGVYLAIAALCTGRVISRFDDWLDRPGFCEAPAERQPALVFSTCGASAPVAE